MTVKDNDLLHLISTNSPERGIFWINGEKHPIKINFSREIKPNHSASFRRNISASMWGKFPGSKGSEFRSCKNDMFIYPYSKSEWHEILRWKPYLHCLKITDHTTEVIMEHTDPIAEEQPFYNEWIDLQNIPKAEDTVYTGLDAEYLYVRLSNVLVITIIGGVPLALFLIFNSLPWNYKWTILGVFILLMLIWAVMVLLEFRHRGYVIREQDIAYRSGLIFRRRQFLPFRRVQHCKITEGLIERLFNFSTVVVSAAGDDIVIHGLRPDEAQNLQQFINEKVDTMTKEMYHGRR